MRVSLSGLIILAASFHIAAPAHADKRLKGIACRSVHLWYSAPEGTAFYNEVTVDNSADGTYFMACGFRMGYFGIQELANGKKVVLFSVWDPGKQNNPNATPKERPVQVLFQGKGVRVRRFGGEGTGGQSSFDYNWKIGERCRFLVRAQLNGKRTAYAGYFYLNKEKRWHHLVTFSTLAGGRLLHGYYSFVEDFRRNRISTTKIRRAKFGNTWICTKAGKWLPAVSARFTGDSNPATNINAGAEKGRYFLATGGKTQNTEAKLRSVIGLPNRRRAAPNDLPKKPLLPKGAASTVPVLGKQLFVDDHVIAKMSGITRELATVKRENGGKPIFTEGLFYGTVLYDQGKFRMWYRKPKQRGYGLAESKDGIRFHTVADIKGINFAGDYTCSVSLNNNAKTPRHRYLAAYDGPGMRAAIAHSSDGIHWTPFNKGQPVTRRAADTYNQIIWDESAKTYRLFTRTDFGPGGGPNEWRGVRSMTNPDIFSGPTNWKTVRSWVFKRDGEKERKRRQIYALTDWIYHGVHFALMSVYEYPGDLSEGPANLNKRHERDVMNFYIATSRDADSWDLRWVYARKPMIPRGPAGAFDNDMLVPASTIVTHDNKHWLYYGGANERHGIPARKSAIGLATLRLDGFVCLHAADKGTVTTKAYQLPPGKLQINVDATPGEIQVEMLDAKGRVIAQSQPIRGDHLKAAVRFDNVIEPRQTLSLRFVMRKCKLYSFWFE